MYELAHDAAREAQRAFHFERGHATRRFLPEETWDDLHQGLLAGERLDFALRQMEKAYLDENRREHELTKHLSLRLDFPAAYLRLRITGELRDQHPRVDVRPRLPRPLHATHQERHADAPCVTGPYTGVHCRLTLLSSMTRIQPGDPSAGPCAAAGDGTSHSEYAPCHGDPRVVREYAARESIATSSGQNDSGLFELSFRDERYLPFEYLGAVSRWRIELPQENNYFDLDTLTDAGPAPQLHGARGRRPRCARRPPATPAAVCPATACGCSTCAMTSPTPGRRCARPDPEHQSAERDIRHRSAQAGLHAGDVPVVPGRRVRSIDRLLIMFAAPDAVPGRQHLVRFRPQDDDRDDVREFACVADGAWPGFFCGAISLREHPLRLRPDERPATCIFEIPASAGDIRNVFVVAHYDAERWPHRPGTMR